MNWTQIGPALAKLLAAMLCGLALAWANRRRGQEGRPWTDPLEQAQVLLCVAGALMMIVIGDSLARAFGVAGAAGIIRFRTPVESPRDTILLFVLLGLGMACGLGAYTLAVIGAIGVGLLLRGMDLLHGEPEAVRRWTLEVSVVSGELPVARIHELLEQSGARFQPTQILVGENPGLKYEVALPAGASLEQLNERLVSANRDGLRLEWVAPKQKRRKREAVQSA